MPGTLLIGFRNANGTYSVVSAANPLPVTGGGGGGGSTSVTATAAAPTYVEGSTTNPLSVDLAGGLRVTGKVGIDQTTPGTTNGVVIKDSAGNAIDQTATVNVAQDSAVMKLAAVSVTPKFAKIALSASGDPIAAVTSKKIRVLAYNIMGAGAVNAKFQSNATTDLTGLKYIAAAGGGICAPFNPVGWFETVAGEKLTLNLSASVGVGGEITYIEV